MPARGGLAEYNRKRDFARTGEPKGARKKSGKKLSYLIQKHAARRLHYDFRLEWNGALLSWAVPKGPSENPEDKRLAVHVEDHPVEYGKFEGTHPRGRIWRRHGDAVGPRQLGAARRRRRGDEARASSPSTCTASGCRANGRWCGCAAATTTARTTGC